MANKEDLELHKKIESFSELFSRRLFRNTYIYRPKLCTIYIKRETKTDMNWPIFNVFSFDIGF